MPLRADGLNILGVFAWYAGRLGSARACIEESLALCRQIGDQAKVASALNNLALIATTESNDELARNYLEECVEIFELLGEKSKLGDVLANLGSISRGQHRFDEAIGLLSKAALIKRDIGDDHGLAITLGTMACVHLHVGQIEEAKARMRESLDLVEAIHDDALATTALIDAAYLAKRQGQFPQCARLLGAVDASVDRLGIQLQLSHEQMREEIAAALFQGGEGSSLNSERSAGKRLGPSQAIKEALTLMKTIPASETPKS